MSPVSKNMEEMVDWPGEQTDTFRARDRGTLLVSSSTLLALTSRTHQIIHDYDYMYFRFLGSGCP